jgi:hypothetical protein
VLNQPRYQGASILLARKNFGCGSSREHRPWALQQYGFRALIAPSYADIFFNNCFKNGLLPIQLSELDVTRLFDEVAAFVGYRLTIDSRASVVIKPMHDPAVRGRAVPQGVPAGRARRRRPHVAAFGKDSRVRVRAPAAKALARAPGLTAAPPRSHA